MKISNKGLSIIKKFEGCRLKAYKCPAGVLTIGYGHTGSDVKSGMTITESQAEDLLKKDLSKFERKVEKYNSVYNFNQNQFDALVSFAFNVGNIDQLTNNGKRSIAEISAKIPSYNKAGGKVLSGLTSRRSAEKKLFDTKVTIKKTTTKTTTNNCETSDTKMPQITKGSTGKAVKIWQIIIGVNPDGDFGNNTLTVTKEFQKEHSLTVDGIVGTNSWKVGLESV